MMHGFWLIKENEFVCLDNTRFFIVFVKPGVKCGILI